MKIIIFAVFFVILSSSKELKQNYEIKKDHKYFRFANIKNPDQVAADSGGGDNGEFLRRNQPQEHLIIPLINNLEAEYNPVFSDIKKFRKKSVKKDKGIVFRIKEDKELTEKINKLLKF
jgi:hypothetical protein